MSITSAARPRATSSVRCDRSTPESPPLRTFNAQGAYMIGSTTAFRDTTHLVRTRRMPGRT
jgi:hypothetical protein